MQESPFDDCTDADITAAYEAGIIGGIEKGVFGPDRVLTREQMAIMIARTLKVCNIDLTAEPFYRYKGIMGFFESLYQPALRRKYHFGL